MRAILFGLCCLVSLTAAPTASASTVKFELAYDSVSFTWKLCASDQSGIFSDNRGIASYGVSLTGTSTVDHKSPRAGVASGPSGIGPAGFTTLRTADGVSSVMGHQDTLTPTPNLIFGFGQTSSSFAAKGMTDISGGSQLEQPVWGGRLLLAEGSYPPSGPHPNFNIFATTFATVFNLADSRPPIKSASIVAEAFDVNDFAADFDSDHDVDAADLALWRVGFGVASGATRVQGDADRDHDVDGADFLVWQRQLGAGAAVAAAMAVPEPLAWVLLMVAGVVGEFAWGRRIA